jgi:hypothetical protein
LSQDFRSDFFFLFPADTFELAFGFLADFFELFGVSFGLLAVSLGLLAVSFGLLAVSPGLFGVSFELLAVSTGLSATTLELPTEMFELLASSWEVLTARNFSFNFSRSSCRSTASPFVCKRNKFQFQLKINKLL